ncbi:hypothetical protein FB561_0827 [Kribbella amoyensis]|uniref:Uncharacterized protein n=1 Tax=Kribbella amoyensis TaxID=996641 RepID=A0A561BLS1_9ACTN|nr:hypothetical protein [Kribbella amoyensis]TWD79762.1 hypothetical protein FB561_0827 [Kribbella amoyensis]
MAAPPPGPRASQPGQSPEPPADAASRASLEQLRAARNHLGEVEAILRRALAEDDRLAGQDEKAPEAGA